MLQCAVLVLDADRRLVPVEYVDDQMQEVTTNLRLTPCGQ